MDVISSLPNSNTQIDQYPLLVECMESSNDHEHIIDITRHGDTLSSSLNEIRTPREELDHPEDQLLSGTQGFTEQASSLPSTRATSRNSSFTSRGDGYGHHRRNPLNSGFWISIELLVTVGQIIASVVVLVLSKNEKPEAPLFIWVLGYASGCTATLPILYWRFRNRNQGSHTEAIDTNQESLAHEASESGIYTAVSVSQPSDEENFHSIDSAMRNNQNAGHLTSRLNGLMEHLKMAVDCFFAVWFVVGNVWIFGGHTSPSDAPKLYKLCIVFLTFSCVGYAMPFILCATICCCMPCIISLLGVRESFSQTRGATLETINSLPTYKFKLMKGGNDGECNDGEGEGEILDADSEKRRAISSEDAMCCICLSQYMDDDELRELPCIHVFHVGCVDKWLKINASCPLCKFQIGESNCNSTSTRDSSHQQ